MTMAQHRRHERFRATVEARRRKPLVLDSATYQKAGMRLEIVAWKEDDAGVSRRALRWAWCCYGAAEALRHQEQREAEHD